MPPLLLEDCERCVDEILRRVGKRIILGTPLGIGKPNPLVNTLYRRAAADRTIELDIITALSLNPPTGKSELEERFMKPLRARIWGDYPRLEYEDAVESDSLPPNIRVMEFYVRSGALLGHPRGQQDYISSNYTHVARDMLSRGVNVAMQSLAMRIGADGQRHYSLSSNPDVTVDLLPLARAQGQALLTVGMVNRKMPWMGSTAIAPEGEFAIIVDDPQQDYRPFAVPHEPVGASDHAIGLYASQLVRDGGTLQVGIGALGDAACHALRLRQRDNAQYRRVLEALGRSPLADTVGGEGRFETGLYVASEMVSYPLYSLFEDGIVRRAVYALRAMQRLVIDGLLSEGPPPDDLWNRLWRTGDFRGELTSQEVASLQYYGLLSEKLRFAGESLILPSGEPLANDLTDPAVRAALDAEAKGPGLRHGTYLQGAFFLGPEVYYDKLRALPDAELERIEMNGVGFVNDIDADSELGRLQRLNARFVNITMKVTMLGAAVSDQVANGQVISGVGGQYNFVSMAHRLPEARSILLFRAVRESKSGLESNVVWQYPHATIPRHLRDIYITEYGIADLRGRSDRECIEAMLAIADSRFQEPLAEEAKRAGKLPNSYRVPEAHRNNLPEAVAARLRPYLADGTLPALPFGCDILPEELELAGRLRKLDALTRDWAGRRKLVRSLVNPADDERQDVHWALQHMGLTEPHTAKERLLARLVRAAMQLPA